MIDTAPQIPELCDSCQSERPDGTLIHPRHDQCLGAHTWCECMTEVTIEIEEMR